MSFPPAKDGGYDVYFQTGTDEHGEKIEIKAKEAIEEEQLKFKNMSFGARLKFLITGNKQ